jgi:hypothetical protein
VVRNGFQHIAAGNLNATVRQTRRFSMVQKTKHHTTASSTDFEIMFVRILNVSPTLTRKPIDPSDASV